ncbi:MAG: SAP domain-containing protein [Nitrosomonadales bacterium]|nr:SAP domain-containing protein [Nitrosomonadales bacterium]
MSGINSNEQVTLGDPAVKVNKSAKIELIRKFQRVEGNYDCCASTYNRVCQQFECLWREECLAMAQD